MCLAVPVKVTSIENEMLTCQMGEGATFVTVSGMLLESEPQIGDYLIVHAGFALRKLSPVEAEETLKLLREMVSLNDGPEESQQSGATIV